MSEIDKAKVEILKKIGERMVLSIKRNFRESGRPVAWKQSKRAMGKHRSKRDKKLRQGKTLIDTGILFNSFHYETGKDSVDIGTNVEYAKIHDQGGSKTFTQPVRAHQRTLTSGRKTNVRAHNRSITIQIPQRQFMIIQKEDDQYFERLMDRVLTKAIKEGLENDRK